MNKTLDRLLSLAADQAHLILLGLKQRQLAPSWIFVQADGTVRMLATPWDDDDQKDAAVSLVVAWMRTHGTVAYSFLCEAWTARLEPEEYPDSHGLIPEADRPVNRVDRREVVMVIASDGQETEFRQWKIVRDWQGNICGLAHEDMAQSEIAPESRFAGLLSREP